MQKHLRLVIFLGALSLAAPSVFATSGPGDGDPPPPSSAPSTTATPTSAVYNSIVAALLGYLGL